MPGVRGASPEVGRWRFRDGGGPCGVPMTPAAELQPVTMAPSPECVRKSYAGEVLGPYPEKEMTWLHAPRGGYGYVYRLPVRVKRLSQTSDRVQVEVTRGDGARVLRWVRAGSLTEKTNTDRQVSGRML